MKTYSNEIKNYLEELYKGWENNPERLFADENINIPINQNGDNGFTTKCPPIPWMGELNSKIVVISLEPLWTKSFEYQCEIASKSFGDWQNFYLSKEYFYNLYGNKKFTSDYWKKLASIILGLVGKKDNSQNNLYDYLNNNWISICSENIIEFPLIQYHARKHPKNYKPYEKIISDLKIRLSFLTHKSDDVLIVIYGKNKFNYIKSLLAIDQNSKSEFDGCFSFNSKKYKKVLVIPQNSQHQNYSLERLNGLGKHFK